MLYSSPHNVFPDLNYFNAPFCIMNPLFSHTNFRRETSFRFIKENKNFPFISPFHFSFLPRTKKVKIQIVNNFEIIPDKDQKKEIFSTVSSSQDDQITNELITEFNTYPQLRKIHSTYHLKRKVTTKFQNDVKNHLNKLISELNMKSDYKLPFVSPISKAFREDVKIESLRKCCNITIAKYISEDVDAGRSLNLDNISLIEKINKIYENDSSCLMLKEIHSFLNKTTVSEYYTNFLHSERYKKCFENDIKRYLCKLNTLNFKPIKRNLYEKIFREKYEGIANSYFGCE